VAFVAPVTASHLPPVAACGWSAFSFLHGISPQIKKPAESGWLSGFLCSSWAIS